MSVFWGWNIQKTPTDSAWASNKWWFRGWFRVSGRFDLPSATVNDFSMLMTEMPKSEVHPQVPSGNLTYSYRKSPFLMGKSTIKWPFSIAMLVYERVPQPSKALRKHQVMTCDATESQWKPPAVYLFAERVRLAAVITSPWRCRSNSKLLVNSPKI